MSAGTEISVRTKSGEWEDLDRDVDTVTLRKDDWEDLHALMADILWGSHCNREKWIRLNKRVRERNGLNCHGS